MGMLNKLAFWKKEDDFDFDKAIDSHEPAPSPFDLKEGDPQPGSPLHTPTSLYPQQTQQQYSGNKDRELELLNSKLDTIKAILNSMDQRIANLERAAGVEQKEKLW